MNKRIGLEKQKRDVVFLDVVQLPGLTFFCCCVSIIYEKKINTIKKLKINKYIYIYIEKEKNMKKKYDTFSLIIKFYFIYKEITTKNVF